jgi:hypothetical protein
MKDPRVVQRQVARVLLLGNQGRLLLLCGPDPSGGQYWYPPVRQIEEDESPEAVARRELNELGLDVTDVGRLVLRRRTRFAYGDQLPAAWAGHQTWGTNRWASRGGLT